MLICALALLSVAPGVGFECKRVGNGIDAGRPVYVLNTAFHNGNVIVIEPDGIWQSKTGEHWKQIASVDKMPGDPPSGLLLQFNGSLWVLGTRRRNEREVRPEIWRSQNGIDWTKSATTMPGAALFSKVHSDRIWIIGENGRSWNGDGQGTWRQSQTGPWVNPLGAASFIGKLFIFDVNGKAWSTKDGSQWTQETSGPWRDRERPQFAVLDNHLLMVGGFKKTDYWHTGDGVKWHQERMPNEYFPRGLPTPAVTPNGLLLVGGKSGLPENSNPPEVWLISTRNEN